MARCTVSENHILNTSKDLYLAHYIRLGYVCVFVVADGFAVVKYFFCSCLWYYNSIDGGSGGGDDVVVFFVQLHDVKI